VSDRVQKLLASFGLGSRREIEGWISAGRISVNGVVAKLGDSADITDKITVDGVPVRLQEASQHYKSRVLAYYKPEGEVSSRSDPQRRPTIFRSLPRLRSGRWIAVGRLDINTSGLILLTNDGELAHKLMHPSSEIEREYAVRILGEVDNTMLKNLREGVTLDDGVAHFERIVEAGGQGANHWYHVILKEGRNREVRRLWESQGVTVSRLMRVRVEGILLRKGLKPGSFDELSSEDVAALRDSVGLKSEPSGADSAQPRSVKRQLKPTAKRKNVRSHSKAVPGKAKKAKPWQRKD